MSIPFDLSELESKPLTDPKLQKWLNEFDYFQDIVKWLLAPPARDAVKSQTVLSKLIKITSEAVQPRAMGWKKQLVREDKAKAVRPEDRWERTIWRKWRPFTGNMPKTSFHTLAPMILSYQLPLYGKQKSERWGKIDLIGISCEHLPVAIELKAEDSKESPIAAVLQAVRYGVALREMWDCGLRDDWINALEDVGIVSSQPQPKHLEYCQLICAAPPQYWEQFRPKADTGVQGRRAWAAFRELCTKLATDHRLPVELVKLEFSATTLPAEDES